MDVLKYYQIYYLGLRRGYVFLLTNLVVALLIPYLFSSYPQNSRSVVRRQLPLMLLSCLGMDAVGVVSCLLLGQADGVSNIGGCLLLILFACCSKERPVQERIALAYAYVGSYPNIVSFLMTIGLLNEEENHILQAILSLLTVVLLPAIVQLYRRITEEGLEADWLLVPIAVIGTFGAFFGTGGYWLKIDPVMKLPMYVLMIMLQIGVYVLVFYAGSWLRRRQNDHAEAILRQADEAMLNVLKSNLATYRKMRHDMENHYHLMRSLLEQGEYDKLKAYFDEYSNQFVPTFSTINCGNNTVTVILNMELEKAKQAGLALEASAAVPEELGIADTDLCSLLVNLIDNAIEYLSRHPELENRTITAELQLVRKNLLVTVKNVIRPEDEAQALSLKTSKENKAYHGLGTKIARSVVERYNGVLRYQVREGCFVADAMLTERG